MNSATVSAGDTILASQYNNARKDILENAGDYNTAAGSANAYTLSVDAQIAAYATRQVFKFKANFTNTAAATLNVNSLGAKTIKKNGSNDLAYGDIQNGQIVEVIYDGTNMQLLSIASAGNAIKAAFGGDGSDGALDTSSGVVNIDCANAKLVTKYYSSINVVTNNLTFTNPNTNGTIVVLKSTGNVTISATIDLTGMGAAGGAGGTGNTGGSSGGTQGSNGNNAWAILDPTPSYFGGKAGTTNTNRNGGSSGSGYVGTSYFTKSAELAYRRANFITPGAGGGGGQAGWESTGVGFSNGGNGGNGGGAIIIECGGALNFTGTINVSGQNGATPSTATANTVSCGAGGGGGGGGAGMALVYYNVLTANTGTITSAGGNGGAGGNTNKTGAGQSTACGGGGGGGAGAYGGAGGGGASGPAALQRVGGNNGNASSSTGAGGGGGSGAVNDNGTSGTNTGGTAGAGGSSDGGVVTSRVY